MRSQWACLPSPRKGQHQDVRALLLLPLLLLLRWLPLLLLAVQLLRLLLVTPSLLLASC